MKCVWQLGNRFPLQDIESRFSYTIKVTHLIYNKPKNYFMVNQMTTTKKTAAKKPSQNERIVKYLRSGKALTVENAKRQFGVQRLSARIWEIRSEENIPVQTKIVKRNGQEVTAYFL